MRLFIIVLFLLSLLGCRNVSLHDLATRPAAFLDKEVSVCGRVIESVNIGIFKGYVIEEGADHLLVLADTSVPREGEDTCAEGVFTQAFKVPGYDLNILDTRKKGH